MGEIVEIARRHGLRVVEDAAQAHGAAINDRRVGQWGDLACFSFYPGKNLGAYGDAGAVVTDDTALAQRIAKLRDHGRSEKYVSDILGSNKRLDTLQAAVLEVKLKHLEKWNEARRKIAAHYVEGLRDLPLGLPTVEEGCQHVYHLFVVRTKQRERLQQHLTGKSIATGIHYPLPLHLQPALGFLGYARGDFPVVELLAEEILSLPMYPEMTVEQSDHVVRSVREFFA
jgi:dTDP-4-amino-4,6-dideoxygalactose transaminase